MKFLIIFNDVSYLGLGKSFQCKLMLQPSVESREQYVKPERSKNQSQKSITYKQL